MIKTQITGTVLRVADEKSGVSQKTGNNWHFITFDVKQGEYDTFPIKVFGDELIKSANLQVGCKYNMSIKITSNEYNGKHYADISLESAQPVVEEQSLAQTAEQQQIQQMQAGLAQGVASQLPPMAQNVVQTMSPQAQAPFPPQMGTDGKPIGGDDTLPF